MEDIFGAKAIRSVPVSDRRVVLTCNNGGNNSGDVIFSSRRGFITAIRFMFMSRDDPR